MLTERTDQYSTGPIAADEQKVPYTSSSEREPLRADSGHQNFPNSNPGQVHQTYALQTGHDPRLSTNYPAPVNNDMGRLEALVAVATSENRAGRTLKKCCATPSSTAILRR